MSQHLEDLDNPVNKYFPNDQLTLLQKSEQEGKSIQSRLMDFNVTVQIFLD